MKTEFTNFGWSTIILKLTGKQAKGLLRLLFLRPMLQAHCIWDTPLIIPFRMFLSGGGACRVMIPSGSRGRIMPASLRRIRWRSTLLPKVSPGMIWEGKNFWNGPGSGRKNTMAEFCASCTSWGFPATGHGSVLPWTKAVRGQYGKCLFPFTSRGSFIEGIT